MPHNIINELDEKEIETIIYHLQTYQSSGDERRWEIYRKKIPHDLLTKWNSVVKEYRKNGFINPYIKAGKLSWAQIIGDRRHADDCTVCSKTYVDGSCMGKSLIENNKFDFIPCWK